MFGDTETFRNVKFYTVRLVVVCGACVFRCVALGSEPGTGGNEHPFRTVRFFWGCLGIQKRSGMLSFYTVRLVVVCGACVFRCVALGSEPGTGEVNTRSVPLGFFGGCLGIEKRSGMSRFYTVRLGVVCGACVFRCVALGSEPGTGESEHPSRTVTFFFGGGGGVWGYRNVPEC